MPSTRNKVQPQNISHEHELDSKGVYQLANGAWAYRFCKSVNGKNVYKRASTDPDENLFSLQWSQAQQTIQRR